MAARFDRQRWDAVVFDVDGTLYEQRPLRRRMLLELGRYCALRPWRVGLLGRLQSFRRHRERLSDEQMPGVRRLQYELPAAALGIPAAELERDVSEWMERRPLRHLAACRVAGARRFFGLLRAADVKIGVLSDYPPAAKLAALGLEADVGLAGTDPEIDRLKPHPAGLLAVIDRLGVAAERCLMVGDRDDRDGACARRAGAAYLHRLPAGAAPPTHAGSFRTYLELLE